MSVFMLQWTIFFNSTIYLVFNSHIILIICELKVKVLNQFLQVLSLIIHILHMCWTLV